MVRVTVWVLAVGLLAGAPAAAQGPLELQRRGRLPRLDVTLQLLARSDVRDELELVESQLLQLQQLRLRLRQQMRAALAGAEPSETSIREQLRQTALEIDAQAKQELERILLPHQTRRLAQLVLQARLWHQGAGALLSPSITEQLKITPQQQDELAQQAVVVEEDYQRRLVELRREVQEKLLRMLTPDQQLAFQQLVGEPFEFSTAAADQTRFGAATEQ